MRRSCVDLPERRPSQKSYFSPGKENYLDIESWKKKSSHQSNPLSILPSPKSSNQYRSKHSSILTLIHFLAITSSSKDILERRRPPLSRERPRLVQACYQRLWRLEHPQPRASSPSYNLLVNFASLLEGYVRWDKKYLERERERLDYSSSGRAYQAPSSPYARVTDILCRCAQPASQTVRTWSLAAASAATAQRERETPLAV